MARQRRREEPQVKYFVMMLIVSVGCLLPISAVPEWEFEIPYDGQRIGSVKIDIVPDTTDQSRALVSAAARFDSFTQTLDRILGSRGDFLGGCSKRLYWAGGTRVRDAGASLGLASRARYEQWLCGAIKTRLLRDTKTFHWRVLVRANRIENIRLEARVENIENFPNDLERAFGLRVTEILRLPIPARCGKCSCSEMTRDLEPVFRGAQFSMDGGTLRLKVEFSIKNDLLVIMPCMS